MIPDQQLFCWLFVVIPDHHLFCKSPHSTSIAVLTSIYLSSLLNSPLHCPGNCSVLSWTIALASNLASLASAVNSTPISPLHNSKDDNPSCHSNPWLAIFLWLAARVPNDQTTVTVPAPCPSTMTSLESPEDPALSLPARSPANTLLQPSSPGYNRQSTHFDSD